MPVMMSDWQMVIGLTKLVISYIMLYIAVVSYFEKKDDDDDKNNRH